MTLRSASLIAAAALAGTAAPALAQDDRYDPGPPPPLPGIYAEEWEEEWEDRRAEDHQDTDPSWEEEHRGAHDAYSGEWRRHDLPPAGTAQPMGYSAGQRAHWLEQCRAAYHDDRGRRLDECEDYLFRYEQSFRGYGYAPHGAFGYGYPYGPVVWVKVPIVSSRRHGPGCGCETVVEEWIEEEPAPAPRARPAKIRRVTPAPAPDKRVRIGK